MNAQPSHLLEMNYNSLASAPQYYPFDTLRDSEGNWYRGARLIKWHADHIVFEQDGVVHPPLYKNKISALTHQFVPQPELALQFA